MNELEISLLIGALGGSAIGLKKWREEGPTEDHPENSDHKR